MQSREVEQSADVVSKSEIKASVTALSVAMAYTRALSLQAWSVSNPAEIALATHLWQKGKLGLTGFNYAFSSLVSNLPFSLQHSIFNKVVAPGYDETIMLRKLMIADQVENAIAGGIKQVVFLGGGYDVRAFMVARRHYDVSVYELDRGPTRESKMAGMMSIPTRLGYSGHAVSKSIIDGTLMVGANLKYIECDLVRGDIAVKLGSHLFDPTQASLFIGEGLTMYLSVEDNQKLLRNLFNLMTDDSRCLISFMSPRLEMGSIERNALKDTGEMYRTPLHPVQVIPFVGSCGFDIAGCCTVSDRLSEMGIAGNALLNETYYLMNKSASVQVKSINDVPRIDFPLPAAHAPASAPAPASSMCTIV